MRTVALVTCLAVGAAAASSPPPPPPPSFSDVREAARAALDACTQLGVKARVYGDVEVKLENGALVASASKSLGALGPRAETCVREALVPHFNKVKSRLYDHVSHTQYIGTPVPVLPPIATLMPLWRRAMTSGIAASVARGALRSLVPADYTLTAGLCLKTTRSYASSAEMLWLANAGVYVPRMWHGALQKVLGAGDIAMWTDAGELLVHGARGLCLFPFGPARQPAMQAEFDKLGTCWAGTFEDILLHPRFAFPTDRSYTQVAMYAGRACALTTTGDVTCCGNADPPLPAAPGGLRSIALGHKYACGLDAKQAIVCWGDIATPPRGKFTKVSASHAHACGLAADGTLACWGADHYDVAKPPAGTFIDVAASDFSSCGIRSDGSAQCWGHASRETQPPGLYTAVTASSSAACGLRRDRLVACWTSDHDHVRWPSPAKVKQLGDGGGCNIRDDGTLACTGRRPAPPYTNGLPPPKGRFTQLAGAMEARCGVREDQQIECWGDTWPGDFMRDNKFFHATYAHGAPPYMPPPAMVQGRLVDETGAPIANGEVLACLGERSPCTSISRWAQRTSGSLADRVAASKADPATYALATTAADGTWKVAPPTRPSQLLFAATDREVVLRGPDDVERVALRPASSIELLPTCGGAPCTGKLAVQLTAYNWFPGSRIERLEPGTYAIELYENRGEKGERRGVVTVDVTYVAKALRIPVAMTPSGTGKAIAGTFKLVGGGDVTKHELVATCGPREQIRRRAKPAADGTFTIEDVGPPPCKVTASGTESRRGITVTKLPATGLLVEDRALRPPRFP